jgi:hypothetical protein
MVVVVRRRWPRFYAKRFHQRDVYTVRSDQHPARLQMMHFDRDRPAQRVEFHDIVRIGVMLHRNDDERAAPQARYPVRGSGNT